MHGECSMYVSKGQKTQDKEKKSYKCRRAPDINMNFMKAGYGGVSIEWQNMLNTRISSSTEQIFYFFLILVFPCIFDKYKNIFANKCTVLIKHKMLQFVLKISLYMAPTCFGPSWTIIRKHMMEPC